MKKRIMKFLAIPAFVAIALTSLMLAGCADANGLHNQSAVMVTFEFKNFPATMNGSDWVVCGEFNNWNETKGNVSFNAGNGKTEPIAIGLMKFKFTLIPVNNWTRTWYPTVKGNAADETQGGAYHNFWIEGIDSSAGEVTIVLDASSGTATPVAQ